MCDFMIKITVSFTWTNRLMLFREVISLFVTENCMNPINRSRVLLEMPTSRRQLVNKLAAFCGTRRFLAVECCRIVLGAWTTKLD